MHPDAEVRVPADTAYVAVVRMATAAIAARLDFTLDDIEDLRMAVGEACALTLNGAAPGGTMQADYHLTPDRIEVHVSADTTRDGPPDPSSFAWQVLTSTAEDVTGDLDGGRVVVRLAVSRNAAAQTV
jgi:serine/threonine-protein kinase RsbW